MSTWRLIIYHQESVCLFPIQLNPMATRPSFRGGGGPWQSCLSCAGCFYLTDTLIQTALVWVIQGLVLHPTSHPTPAVSTSCKHKQKMFYSFRYSYAKRTLIYNCTHLDTNCLYFKHWSWWNRYLGDIIQLSTEVVFHEILSLFLRGKTCNFCCRTP